MILKLILCLFLQKMQVEKRDMYIKNKNIIVLAVSDVNYFVKTVLTSFFQSFKMICLKICKVMVIMVIM